MKTKITLLSAAIACLSAVPAIAQSEARISSLLEEIVVTAQKREASLQDTPIAVTAFTSEQMSDFGITDQQDIANFTPSMSYQEAAGGGEANRIYIRGVGRETNVLGTEPGVGLYNNGFYGNESSVLAASTDRLERIEILRGPQGTLFGRNTTGGAINVVAKRPGEEQEIVARFNTGSYSSRTAELTASGPVSEKVGYLLHYRQHKRDSFYTNVSGEDPIGNDESYFEGQLDVDFTDNINWNFRYYTGEYENETLRAQKLTSYLKTFPLKQGAIVVNPELFAALNESPSVNDPFDIDSDFQGRVKVEDSNAYQSTLTIDLEGVTVRMLNGYQESTWAGEKDYDRVSSLVSFTENIQQIDESTQHEIQLISNGDGPVQWVAGLFYFDNDLYQPYSIHDYGNPYLTTVFSLDTYGFVDNSGNDYYYQAGRLNAETTALYGQVDWDVSDKLTVTAGLRYGEDKKTGFEEQEIHYDTLGCGFNFYPGIGIPFEAGTFAPIDYSAFLINGNPLADACPTDPNPRMAFRLNTKEAEHEAKWDAVTWRLNANYEITDTAQMYATVSTGYKTGGFRLGGMQDDPATSVNESIVDEETLVAYELGYKGNLSDTLTVNAAAYFYDYEDMQVELDILDQSSGISTSQLLNAPKVEIYGFELETNWAATEKLSFLFNYSYNKSEVVDDFMVGDPKTFASGDTPIQRNAKGNELNRSPNNKIALGAFYVHPFETGTLVATASYVNIGKQYVTIHNDDIESIDSYSKVDARLSWKAATGKYEVSAYADNVTDEVSYANFYAVGNQQVGQAIAGRSIAPRTFGAEIAFFF